MLCRSLVPRSPLIFLGRIPTPDLGSVDATFSLVPSWMIQQRQLPDAAAVLSAAYLPHLIQLGHIRHLLVLAVLPPLSMPILRKSPDMMLRPQEVPEHAVAADEQLFVPPPPPRLCLPMSSWCVKGVR